MSTKGKMGRRSTTIFCCPLSVVVVVVAFLLAIVCRGNQRADAASFVLSRNNNDGILTRGRQRRKVVSPLQSRSKRGETALHSTKTRIAQELVRSLVVDEKCFSTESGARSFGDACAINIVYEDCFEPQPVVGKTPVTNHILAKVAARKGKGELRLDRISDGYKSTGFCWTWTSGNEEGLRGTTFVELSDTGLIQYVREIPEPLYKPGDLTLDLLKFVTQGAEPTPPREYEIRTPTTASDMVRYLFNDVQGSSVDESMRMFDDDIVYRDFNYEEVLRGKADVRKFVEDFNFPGIEFRTDRIDDGIESCCFTWDVVLMDAPETVKGISFYELDPDTRRVAYVRDVPESAIKPPVLGKLARDFRPGLGVFRGVPLGSRPGGM